MGIYSIPTVQKPCNKNLPRGIIIAAHQKQYLLRDDEVEITQGVLGSQDSMRIIVHQNLVFVGSREGDITVYELYTKARRTVLKLHKDAVQALVVFNNCMLKSRSRENVNCLVAASHSGLVSIWDADKLLLLKSFNAEQQGISCITRVAANYFATCSFDKRIMVWNLHHNGLEFGVEVDDPVYHIRAYNGGNSLIFTAENHLDFLDLALRDIVKRIRISKEWDPVYCFEVLSGIHIVAATQSGAIHLVDVSKKAVTKTVTAHDDHVFSILCTPDYVVTGGYDGKVVFWNHDLSIRKMVLTKNEEAVFALDVFGNRFIKSVQAFQRQLFEDWRWYDVRFRFNR